MHALLLADIVLRAHHIAYGGSHLGKGLCEALERRLVTNIECSHRTYLCVWNGDILIGTSIEHGTLCFLQILSCVLMILRTVARILAKGLCEALERRVVTNSECSHRTRVSRGLS